jgi:DegV family protein with EDD domain
VRIVTDSTADLPQDIVADLGITVVPLHIYFGEEHFEDGVTISKDEFYRRLTSPGQPFPRTSAPSSGEFAAAYQRLSHDADEIVSIHLSPKLSATHAAASAASRIADSSCRIAVVDSSTASLALGLLVAHAAHMARSGAGLDEIVRATTAAVPRTGFFGVLETLEYLRRGGRIGRAAALLGSLLNTKPLVGLRNGVAYPIERVRGRQRALQRVIELVESHGSLVHLAVGHTTDVTGMESLASGLSQNFPPEQILRTQCGATLGSYLGPGAFGVALIEAAP